jgi:hypothetical protein
MTRVLLVGLEPKAGDILIPPCHQVWMQRRFRLPKNDEMRLHIVKTWSISMVMRG